MATVVWRGAGGSGSHPKSGSFTDGSNWSGGSVPDSNSNVILAAGRYSVTLEGADATLHSLQTGAGVLLTVSQPDATDTTLELASDSTNGGRLAIQGATVILDGSSTLVNLGEIYGGSGYYTASIQGGGTVLNEGLISAGGGVPGQVLISAVAVQNDAGGVVRTDGGGYLYFANTLQNDGLVSAVDGGLINFNNSLGHGGALNLGEGVLDGGQWSAIGAGSTLTLYNSDIETLAGGAVVTLSGAGSSIAGEDASRVTQIEASLTTIEDGAELHVLGGRDYSTGQDLSIGGLLDVGGGTLTASLIIVSDDPGSTLSGYGVLHANVEMYGLLRADNHRGHQTLTMIGDNDFFGNLGGRGTLELAGGLNVLQPSSKVFVKDIIVDGQNTTLQLGQDLSYDGQLQASAFGALDLDGHVLRLSGKVTLDSGDIDNGQLQLVGAQVTSTGQTVVDSDLRNDAVVTVKNGQFVESANVNGTGEFHVLNSATLAFAGVVTAGQTVFMDGPHATLALATDAGFRGAVSGFAAGDVLNFETVDTTGATLSWKADGAGGGTLTLISGAEKASIHLDGTYQKSLFHLAADADVGTDVTYGASTAPDHAAGHWDAHGGLAI